MRWYPRILRVRSQAGAAKTRPRPPKAPLRLRPQVEVLEERTLLNNRFVVPLGVPVDNSTSFTNLRAALTTAGLVTGDTIEIEPGSAPGNVMNSDFTTAFSGATRLTIQGNPAVGLAGIPQFTITDAVVIAAADTLNLNVANVGFFDTGALTFNGNTSITGSMLTDVNSLTDPPFTFAGGSDNLINSTVVNNRSVSGVLEVATPAGGSSNQISGNTFLCNAAAGTQLGYFNSSATTVAVTDRVSGNTFVGYGAVNIALDVADTVTGLIIQNNTFAGNVFVAIDQESPVQNLEILGNTFNISSNHPPTGIVLGGVTAGSTTSVTVSDNVLNTGGSGTALSLFDLNMGTLNVSIEGNDFHNNQLGINIVAGSNSIAGIDLGGGSQGSVGGNNLRSFTAAATTNSGAIVTDATTGTIQAQNNIFAVSNPQTVISATSGASVNATALSANAAFVDVLYEDFLKRPGNTTSPSDAGSWVTMLNGGASRGSVAAAIVRSAEALGIVVDGLYLKVLGRAADPGGRAAFVSFLQNGGTVEQAVVGMVNSPEYLALTGSPGGFVEGLYVRVLGRGGSSSEVSGWLNMLPNLGLAGVASAIVHSSEFRADVVQALYGSATAATVSVASLIPDLLHRHASTTEVNGWVNSGLDIATIAQAFASTGEFFTGG
jgi:hypothetical protein